MYTTWRRFPSLLLGIALMLSLTSCRLAQRAQDTGADAPSGPVPATSPAPVGVAVPAIDIPGISGVVLFQDDFQDGRADEWTISSSWTVQQHDAAYLFEASGYGGAWLAHGQNWEDYMFRAGVRLNSGNLSMNINLTQTGRYVLNMRPDGVFLLKEYPAGTTVVLSQTGPFDVSVPHAVAIANQGGHLQVYVDRVLWMDYIDSVPLGRGTVGVAAKDGSQVAVDNVLVMGLSTPLPAGVVQAPQPLAVEPPPDVVPSEDGGGLPIAEVEPETEDQGPPEGDQPTGGQPDLILENITMQPSSPEQNQPMVVAVTVRNGGDGQAGAFNIRWNPEGANFVGCSWDIFGLPPGEAVDMVCDYQGYPEIGVFNWGVSVDADGEVAESNEGNNSRSGDIVVTSGLTVELPPSPEGCTVSSWTMNSVTIAWNFPGNQENIEGFAIYQGVTSMEQWVGPPSRSATIDNLEQGVQYHFDVRAYNEAGESDADVCSVDVTPNP